MVAQGLGTTLVTDMMLTLAPRSGLRTLQLRDDIRRHVVLVRRTGESGRPAVQAMTSAIERAVEAALAHTLPG
jgi:hypothetical protein